MLLRTLPRYRLTEAADSITPLARAHRHFKDALLTDDEAPVPAAAGRGYAAPALRTCLVDVLRPSDADAEAVRNLCLNKRTGRRWRDAAAQGPWTRPYGCWEG